MVMDEVSQPFTAAVVAIPSLPTAPAKINPVPLILGTAWVIGLIGIACSWWIRWRRISAAVRGASPAQLDSPIRAICSPSFLEPGVFGIFRPVLLLPEGIFGHLPPEQMKSVLAHELCHVRHRDNLIGMIQMFVETVFWFHPLVWWIGKRIFEERERACDEEVLKLGNEPRVYARGILNVCQLYLESPLPCAAGVSGANLRMRIEAILNERSVMNLSGGAKALLAAAGLFAIAAPIAIGLLHGATLRAQTVSPALRFEVASVRAASPDPRGPGLRSSGIPGPNNNDPGRFRARLNLLNLILIAYDIPLYRLSESGDLYRQQVEIEGIMPVDTTREQFNVMLQNLLADRLGLKVHWTSKEINMYALSGGERRSEV
jgi:bla regulator protein blaR1